jgi:branched-chain amino acid transport system substrate-binding protein
MIMTALVPSPLASDHLRRRLASLLLVLGTVMSTVTEARTVIVGGLLSRTGNWSSLGLASEVMMKMARDDINAYLKQHGSTTRITLVITDTELKPDQAVRHYRHLADMGAVGVVGPQSSSEVMALESVIGRRRVPIISHGSTASSLAKSGDRIYRVVPDDSHEAEAMQALLKSRGVLTVLPMWRNDPGNGGLHDSLKVRLEKTGATMLSGINYSSDDSQDFVPIVEAAHRQLAAALAEPGASSATVAIYVAGFDEVVKLMNAATRFPLLKTVKWYGSDGIAQSDALLRDEGAARYAMAVDFPNPNIGLPTSAMSKWQPLAERYFKLTGESPDAFAMAAYDATWLAALNASYNPSAPRISRRYFMTETAGLFFGATGWTELNSAGDRTRGDYEFWAIRPDSSGNPAWSVVCHYDSASAAVGGSDCPAN